ncbi:hypothetical protein B0H11DRAFT_2027933 [Mycena galericulata]|nr:hypothetical protein B0H11DRAFT_2027933 [Mycena galericulata]
MSMSNSEMQKLAEYINALSPTELDKIREKVANQMGSLPNQVPDYAERVRAMNEEASRRPGGSFRRASRLSFLPFSDLSLYIAALGSPLCALRDRKSWLARFYLLGSSTPVRPSSTQDLQHAGLHRRPIAARAFRLCRRTRQGGTLGCIPAEECPCPREGQPRDYYSFVCHRKFTASCLGAQSRFLCISSIINKFAAG